MEQGDFIEVGLENFDYSILKKESRFFIVINCRIYLYKIKHELINKKEIESKKNYFEEYTEEEVKFAGKFTGVKQ